MIFARWTHLFFCSEKGQLPNTPGFWNGSVSQTYHVETGQFHVNVETTNMRFAYENTWLRHDETGQFPTRSYFETGQFPKGTMLKRVSSMLALKPCVWFSHMKTYGSAWWRRSDSHTPGLLKRVSFPKHTMLKRVSFMLTLKPRICVSHLKTYGFGMMKRVSFPPACFLKRASFPKVPCWIGSAPC